MQVKSSKMTRIGMTQFQEKAALKADGKVLYWYQANNMVERKVTTKEENQLVASVDSADQKLWLLSVTRKPLVLPVQWRLSSLICFRNILESLSTNNGTSLWLSPCEHGCGKALDKDRTTATPEVQLASFDSLASKKGVTCPMFTLKLGRRFSWSNSTMLTGWWT